MKLTVILMAIAFVMLIAGIAYTIREEKVEMSDDLCLDQRTQQRNKAEDSPPFLCYDGENMFKKKRIAVRCWHGLGIIIYAGLGCIQIRGMTPAMNEETATAFDQCWKKAYVYANASEEEV